MVTVLDRGPSFGGQLGQALGGAVGQGVQAYGQMQLQDKVDQFKQSEELYKAGQKRASKLGREFQFINKEFGKNFKGDDLERIYRIGEDLAMDNPTASSIDLFNQAAQRVGEEKQQEKISLRGKSKDKRPLSERSGLQEGEKGLLQRLFGGESRKEDQQRTDQERAAVKEKAKTANKLSDFNRREVFLLDFEDIQNFPEEEQEKYLEILPQLVERKAASIRPAAVPGIGTAFSERMLEGQDIPGGVPLMGEAAQLASELPFDALLLGGKSPLQKSLRGGAAFGGREALGEFIRTEGTEKEADLGRIGLGTLLGSLPGVYEGAKSGSRGLLKKIFPKTAAKGEAMAAAQGATEAIEKRAAALKKKDIKPISAAGESAQKQAAKVKEAPKKVAVSQLKPNQKLTDFEIETRNISKTPVEDYGKPRKLVQTGLAERKETYAPRVNKVNEEIKDFENRIRTEKLSLKQRRDMGDKLLNLRKEKYELDHLVKYNRLPVDASQISKEIEKSSNEIFNHFMNPTEGSSKAIAKEMKRLETFNQRYKDEVIKGNLPVGMAQDQFIANQKAYQKGYKELGRDLAKAIKDVNSPLYQAPEVKEMIKHLEKRNKLLDKAIKVQEQKRTVINALRKPSGAIREEQLKNMGKLTKDFQKDINRIQKLEKSHALGAEIGPKKAKEFGEKVAQGEYAEAAKSLNISEEELKTSKVKQEKIVEDYDKILKDPNSTAAQKEAAQKKFQEDFSKASQALNDRLAGKVAKGKAKNKKSHTVVRFMGGLIAGIIRSKTGMRIPSSVILTKLGVGGAGILSLATWLGAKINKWYKQISSRQRTKARYGF